MGCSGDARRAVSPSLPDLQVGSFPGSTGGLVSLLSSEPLVATAWDGRPVFRLADSAVPSDDGRTLTVRLKKGIKYHSGEPLDAPSVRDILLQKRSMSEVERIDVLDAQTLMLRLERPHVIKPADLSEAPIDDDSRPQLRTGPFKILSLKPEPVLEAYADYDQGAPGIKRVEIHEYPNLRAAWAAMMRGEVNFLHEVNRDSIEFIGAGGHVAAYPLLRPFVVPLVFNLRHPILGRKEVRNAINEALDRAEIVRSGMRGHGEPAEGPFWPNHWAYARGRHTVPFNPEAARLRLDAAGLTVRPGTSGRMPSRFSFRCLLRNNDARFERIALIVQRQLFAVGIDMQLTLVPARAFVQRFQQGDYDAFIFETSTGRTLNFPYRLWHSRGDFAMSGYASADAALDRMKTAAGDAEVRLALADVMRVMRADPPAAFLVTPREVRAADTRFAIPYEQDRDVYGTLWQAQPAAPSQSAASR